MKVADRLFSYVSAKLNGDSSSSEVVTSQEIIEERMSDVTLNQGNQFYIQV
jgi:hypothetical protein